MSEKIRPHHLERKAVLYVRQSSAHQVLHNRESSALQYAMRDRLTALGWSRIETVDEDLGRSAAGVSGGEKLPHGSGRFVWLRRRKIPSPVYLPADLNGRKGEDEASGAVCTGTPCVPC